MDFCFVAVAVFVAAADGLPGAVFPFFLHDQSLPSQPPILLPLELYAFSPLLRSIELAATVTRDPAVLNFDFWFAGIAGLAYRQVILIEKDSYRAVVLQLN